MTGSKITLRDTASAVLAGLVASARHPGELMATFAALMLSSTQRRFQRQQGPDGIAWKPLSSRTANRRIGRRIRGTANMLRVSTRLYQSVTAASDETSAEVGTNLVYAAPHQFGGEIQQWARSQSMSLKRIRGRYRFARHGTKGATERKVTIGEHIVVIPARPYLGFSDPDIRGMIQAGQNWLQTEGAR